MAHKTKQQEMTWGQAGCMALIILPMMLFLVTQMNRCQSSNRQNIASIGEIILLDSDTPDTVLYTSKLVEKEFSKLSIAKDTLGMTAMLVDGRLVYADRGTKVRVLEYAGRGLYEIRILDGEHMGRKMYVRTANTRRE